MKVIILSFFHPVLHITQQAISIEGHLFKLLEFSLLLFISINLIEEKYYTDATQVTILE